MRKLMMIAAPLALAACTSEAVEEEVVEEEAMADEAEAMTTSNGTAAGTYDVTMEDGTVGVSTLNADGTSQSFDGEGNVVQEATWEVVDGQTCFTSESEEGAETECWTESEPAEDGSFTATNADGETVTVSPQG